MADNGQVTENITQIWFGDIIALNKLIKFCVTNIMGKKSANKLVLWVNESNKYK